MILISLLQSPQALLWAGMGGRGFVPSPCSSFCPAHPNPGWHLLLNSDFTQRLPMYLIGQCIPILLTVHYSWISLAVCVGNSAA